MLKILFTDLDDTLFQSHRKQPPEPGWRPVALLSDGTPISYQSPMQQHALDFLKQDMHVIPVTARNHDAYRRVNIPFTAEAILNYGGIILQANGQPDDCWLTRSRHEAQHSTTLLANWQHALQQEAKHLERDASIRLIVDFGIPFYLVVKMHDQNDPETGIQTLQQAAKRIRQHPAFSNVRIHANGNNLAIIPSWLDKRHAVEHLIKQYRARTNALITFGMGDSLIDLGFMGSCDYILTPGTSQIAATLQQAQP
ncbi:hypothetical protein [Rivihabitans pingtungensis]|nr:hypothetical protein [Rivihabitans pingtungensis]